MKKVILSVGGMSCSACSSGLEKYLRKQKGVIVANVNLVLAQAMIEYEEFLSVEDLEKFIEEAGFESLGVALLNDKDKEKRLEKQQLIIFGIFFVCVILFSIFKMISLPLFNNFLISSIFFFVFSCLFLFYGRDILNKGIKNLIHRNPNMDTLVMLGVTSSFLYSIFYFILVIFKDVSYESYLYFESVIMVIYFIKLGRYIDKISKDKTKEAISELVQITPSKALVKKNNDVIEISIDEVKKNDILIAKPGMKIAVDGVILMGETHLDESFINGESVPLKKHIDDKVIAGSINQDGYIEYKAEKIGRDSMISEIVRLVVEAVNTKAPIARIADKVSGYFVPLILIIAITTFLISLILGVSFDESFKSFVTILVVACPCALGLATPLAIVVGEGLCAKNGILVKNSEILENAHKVDTIVFDKTGTLTYGTLKISKVYCSSSWKKKDILKMVSLLENKSTHPIANAFSSYFDKEVENRISSFENIAGIGIKGVIDKKEIYTGNNKLLNKLKIKNKYLKEEMELSLLGNSIVYVIYDSELIALIGVKDIIRENTKCTISKLKEMDKDIIMLTGDNEKTASIIAEDIGITKVISNVLPKEKAKVIKDLKKDNKKVMMVGDGINDALSLASAFIGVSINTGTDIAMDSASVILLNDSLEKIVNLILISEKTIKNIKQNLFWAFFYNFCMIPIAIGCFRSFGIVMNPMFASLAMTLSSLTVVFNVLLLKRYNE